MTIWKGQSFFLIITYFGSEYAYIVLLTLYYWLINPVSARQLGILMGITYGVNTILKEWFQVPRPFLAQPDIANEVPKATAEGWSFPSGHAQGTTTFWSYLALKYRKLLLTITAITIILLVSFSRVYLGVHFFIDVVGGIIIGLIFPIISIYKPFPARQNWLVNIAVVSVSFLIVLTAQNLARPLGVVVGFFLAHPVFSPPLSWRGRLFFGGGGLVIVLGCYIASSWLINVLHLPLWMNYWRYCLLVAIATEIIPRLWIFLRKKFLDN